VNDEELKARLGEVPLPDHKEAEDRAWALVRSTYESELHTQAVEEGSSKGVAVHRPDFRGPAFRLWGLLAVLAAGIIVISPARALVADWVKDVVRGPQVESTKVSTSPPGGGRLLVQNQSGTWVTKDDGSRRLLGEFRDSVWSPKGRFVAAVDDHQLVALTPDGELRWALTRPSPPMLPSWNSPDGFRIAYIERRQLRLVAGDGTGDTVLASGAEAVRPAWRPGLTHDLAFARPRHRVEVLNADSGRRLFTRSMPGSIRGLQWSTDGSRLLVWTNRSVTVLDSRGHSVWDYASKPGKTVETAGVRPASAQVFVLERGRQTQAILTGPGERTSVVIAARSLSDPIWSPNGRRLMVAWPEADQWLFLRGRNLSRVDALGDISQQFSPGAGERARFPTATGWCCTR